VKFIDEYQNSNLVIKLVRRIAQTSTKHINLMEFCGGHTHAIMRYGIREILPVTVNLISGPGCPVCVTAQTDLDKVIALAPLPGVIMATFGDMIRVPGSYSSLQQVKAEGADVRVIYSAMDAVEIARNNPQKPVILIGIGFETTAPTIAASILQAEKEHILNFYVLSLLKRTPPVIKALLDTGEIQINGIIGPGHVSTIIGSSPYEFVPRNYGVGFVISGFEPLDILLCIEKLVKQSEAGLPRVEIAYRRAVKPSGNQKALEIIETVFVSGKADWRGIGIIPESGWKLKPEYRHFDADSIFKVSLKPVREPEGCRCGDIIRGAAKPPECRLFGKVCTPESPAGPCMVSSEGACAAYYSYRIDQ
jgi:hydrogenase expression/formation protein HypD